MNDKQTIDDPTNLLIKANTIEPSAMEKELSLGGRAVGPGRSPARIEESGKTPPSSAHLASPNSKLSGLAKADAPRKMVSSSGSDDSTLPSSDAQRGGSFPAQSAKSKASSSSSQASSNSSDDDGMNNNDDSSGKSGKAKKKKPKLDRSKLRKGKWTVEEEEYTSRIIHYFNTGLLTLPEGATLRSYLADKLNCDPMRVTKKYAGASCLGRRVYHFRDRVHPTIAEIQFAKQELDHLEQRFRMRIERGHASPPVMPPSILPDSLSSTAGVQSMLGIPTVNGVTQQPNVQQLLLSLMSAQNGSSLLASTSQPAAATWMQQPIATAPQAASQPPNVPSLPPVAAPNANMLQMLLLSASKTAMNQPQLPAEAPQQPPPQSQSPPQNVNPAVANWAFVQAAASLGPLLSQLTASNIQQVQQQLHAEQQKAQLQTQIQEQQNRILQQQLQQLQQQPVQPQPAPAPSQTPTQLPQGENSNEKFARELKQAYDSIRSQQQQQQEQQNIQQRPNKNNGFSGPPTVSTMARPSSSFSSQQSAGSIQQAAAAANPSAGAQAKPRTAKDKAGGSDLLGFLSTLRQSYEDALRQKQPTTSNDSSGGIQNMNRLAEVASNVESSGKSDSSSDDANPRHPLVTDSASSQQLESSAEDSEEWTSKKTDPSSSSEGGDSDKEVNDRKRRTRKEVSKGPPRKRHKSMNRQANEQSRN